MRLLSAAYLTMRSLVENPLRTLGSVLAVAFAAAVVVGALAVNSGLVQGALTMVEAAYPPEVIVIRPKSLNLSVLSLSARNLDTKTIDAIRAIPGVESVAPQAALRVPMRAEIDIVGQSAVTDIVIVGVEPSIVREDLPNPTVFSYNAATSQPIPAVAPRFFMDMYNMAYAESMGFPKVNETFIMGKTFRLVLGETYFLGDTGSMEPTVLELKIVGLTANPNLMTGLMIPIGHAMEINRAYGKPGAANTYTAAHVTVTDVSMADSVTSQIVALGLEAESNRETAESFVFAGKAMRLGIGAFAGAVAFFAVFTVLNSFSVIMNERRPEIGLMRAVGASRRRVLALLLAEAGLVGLAGSLAGCAVAAPLLRVGNSWFRESLPPLSFLPETLFALDPATVAIVIAASIVISAGAALPVILGMLVRRPTALIADS